MWKSVLASVLAVILIVVVAWLLACGSIALVCICLGIPFSWAAATGVCIIVVMLTGWFYVIKNM